MTISDLTPWSWRRLSTVEDTGRYPIHRLHHLMDRLWDDFFAGIDTEPNNYIFRNRKFLEPWVDIIEDEKAYCFKAELPGIALADMAVSVVNKVLTIKGEKKADTKGDSERILRMERTFGLFQRSFPLPADADETAVIAAYEDGLLTVRIAKNPSARTSVKHVVVHGKQQLDHDGDSIVA